VIWTVDRAAGVAALLLASASIIVGLLQGRRGGALPAADRFPLHEALGIGVVVAIVIHTLSFAFDAFFGAGLSGALIPFASPYRPLAVAAGQIAGYGLIALSLSFYLRKRWGTRRWRAAHHVIPVFWGLAVLHGFLAGTDATAPWFLISVIAPVLVALTMLAMAADLGPSDPPPTRSRQARAPAAPSRRAPTESLWDR
jgi:sulfoxide reductase heme-binding subunit YedZ